MVKADVTPLSKNYNYFFAAVLIIIFFFISFPGNRVEADDAYRYAYNVTHRGYTELYYNRSIFFLPFFKFLYDVFRSVFQNTDGYFLMCSVSVVCSAVTLLNCYKILRNYLHVDKYISLITCCFILFSYGYWRYSVEAEIYSLVNMLNSFVVLFILKSVQTLQAQRTKYLIIAAVISGFSMLVYKPDFIAVAFSLPLLYLFKKQYRSFILFEVIAGAVVLTGYYFAYKHSESAGGFFAFVNSGVNRSKGNPFLGFFTFLGDIAGVNFALGIKPVVHFIEKRFSYASITEEVFAAKQNGTLNYVALFTLAAVVFGFVYFFIKAAGFVTKIKILREQIVIAIWIVLYGAMAFYFDPNSQEPLVMIIVPFWLFIGSVFFKPYNEKKPFISIAVLALLLLLHNIIGGYLPVRSKNSSLIVQQSQWILHNAKKGDVILAAGQYSGLIWYLRYNSQAQVYWRDEDFTAWLPAIQQSLEANHHLYLLGDISSALKLHANMEAHRQIEAFIQQHSLKQTPVVYANPLDAKLFELSP